jgi:hypothetical protein
MGFICGKNQRPKISCYCPCKSLVDKDASKMSSVSELQKLNLGMVPRIGKFAKSPIFILKLLDFYNYCGIIAVIFCLK